METSNYTFEAVVDTPLKELRFTLQWMRPGEDLMNLVLKALDIREGAFFGLLYTNFAEQDAWLRVRPKLADQGIPRRDVAKFRFSVRVYPTQIEENLMQASTRHFVYLACRKAIMEDEWDCPADICSLLAALEAQAKYGDFNSEEHVAGFLSGKGPFMPSKAFNKHQFSKEEWEQKVCTWWSEHNGLSRIDAEKEYLTIVQKLDFYGVHFFDALNKNGNPITCGITFDGLNIYKSGNKDQPQVTFEWSEISYVKKKGHKVILKPKNKKETTVTLKLVDKKQLEWILSMAIHHHTYQIKRAEEKTVHDEIIKALKIAEEARREEEHQYASRNGHNGTKPNGDTAAVVAAAVIAAPAAVEASLSGPSESELAALRELSALKNELGNKGSTVISLEQKIKELESEVKVTKDALNDRQSELEEAKRFMEAKANEEENTNGSSPQPTNGVSDEDLNKLKEECTKAAGEKKEVEEKAAEVFDLAKSVLESGASRVDELLKLKNQIADVRKDERAVLDRLIKSPFSRKIQMELQDNKYEEKYENFFNAMDKEMKEFQEIRDMMSSKLNDAEKVMNGTSNGSIVTQMNGHA